MKTHPHPEECLEGLGRGFVEALTSTIAEVRSDLATYRTFRPSWVAGHSDRGLANWIHDRMWQHAVTVMDRLDDVVIIDEGPIREVVVLGSRTYRLRLKRHDPAGRVASYRTQGVLEFYEQEQNVGVLPGFEETHLIAGYMWIQASYEIGAPVLSYRDGEENIVWLVELPEADSGVQVSDLPIRPHPPAPQIRPASDSEFGDPSQQKTP